MNNRIVLGVPNKNDYLRKLMELRIEKIDNPEIEWQDIAEFRAGETGVTEHRDTIAKGFKIWDEYYNAGWIKEPVLTETCEHAVTTMKADGVISSEKRVEVSDDTVLQNPDTLMRLHGYDPAIFELVSARNAKWGASSNQLYSSKIQVKPKKAGLSEEVISQWFERLKESAPKFNIEPDTVSANGNKMLLLPISDLHFALRSSISETGGEYNCEIATKVFFKVIKDIIERANKTGYNFKQVVFTIGGDMQNFDNLFGTTTKGTPQDNDGNFYDVTERLYGLTVNAINLLTSIAPVKVIWIPSNHDKTVGFCLAKFCEAWFRNHPNVTVDCSPFPRKYFTFGNTLFCLAHDGDLKRLPKIIPDEARSVWSNVEFTEVMLQHLHAEMVLVEEYNMRIQRLPTISGNSAWTTNMAFKSKRQNKAFIYDETEGLTDILYTNIGRED